MDYSKPIGEPFCNCPSCQRIREQQVPGFVPFTFSAEPAKPEPVYTHVLLPYYEFGEPVTDGAELHTAESLIEAMSTEQANGYGFKVYKLGECIFTIDPSDNSA